jgi:hypothetical protein
MRFSQAALVAILAATVAAKPITARGDEPKSMEEYNKCCESRKHNPSLVCVLPSELSLPLPKPLTQKRDGC